MTNDEAMIEALRDVPTLVHESLAAAGFIPTGDAGNMWFYDRGNMRLMFGCMDGADLPQSLDEECEAYVLVDGSDYHLALVGTLASVLASTPNLETHTALTNAGFVATVDDDGDLLRVVERGDIRLIAGPDGADWPMTIDEEVVALRKHDDKGWDCLGIGRVDDILTLPEIAG